MPIGSDKGGIVPDSADSQITGRYLVLLEDDAVAEGTRAMNRVAGLRMASTADAAPAATAAEVLGGADGLVLHELGVAVVTAAADQADVLTREAGESGPIALVESERRVRALGSAAPAPAREQVDESTFTWGLQAIGAPPSSATGAGVRLAVLDTGFDVDHPDFAGRNVVTSSFIEGESVQDGHGHGTHCIGTSCGPRNPDTGPGYGVAYECDIYAGKVLSNEGSGDDGGILAGISWAIANGCRVVSMSLGADVEPGTPHSEVYERVARRAMARGTVIIAAAGNASNRPSMVAPVGHPANCPSIMAVGAIDVQRAVASFSSGSVDPGGQVDVVGPGVDVYSSWLMPQRYNTISGTSMATPHAAGVAALLGQRFPQADPWELWARLGQSARRLDLPSTAVGAGLVQAP
ncbi:MAG: S8 family serine peptidase [Pseudonocardiaceae bacterium]|nr:S8 family serine peptidase [Pseudonocardiaceae bacterium]